LSKQVNQQTTRLGALLTSLTLVQKDLEQV